MQKETGADCGINCTSGQLKAKVVKMEFVRQFPSELVSNVAEDTLLHLVIKTTIIVPHIFRAKFVHCSATIYTMHI